MSAGTIFLLLAAGVVLMRCACVASHLTPRKWGRERPDMPAPEPWKRRWLVLWMIRIGAHVLQAFVLRIRYPAYAVSLAALGAGALGVALHWQPAGIMLLIGAAGVILFDRRTPRA